MIWELKTYRGIRAKWCMSDCWLHWPSLDLPQSSIWFAEWVYVNSCHVCENGCNFYVLIDDRITASQVETSVGRQVSSAGNSIRRRQKLDWTRITLFAASLGDTKVISRIKKRRLALATCSDFLFLFYLSKIILVVCVAMTCSVFMLREKSTWTNLRVFLQTCRINMYVDIFPLWSFVVKIFKLNSN